MVTRRAMMAGGVALSIARVFDGASVPGRRRGGAALAAEAPTSAPGPTGAQPRGKTGASRVRSSMPVAKPKPLTVPPKLAARFRGGLETSGFAWAPTLDRYLVVIDETNDAVFGARTPLLLALSADGVFDEEPLRIAGLDELDDPESICAAGPNRFFLLTSHSTTRAGRFFRARRQLIELALDGRALQARSTTDLLEGRAGLPGLLRTLGVESVASLDVEAIAFHDDALFIGLKAPLTPKGEALIFKIDELDRAFHHGRVRRDHLSFHRRVLLAPPSSATSATSDAGAVRQGIADLAFVGQATPSLYIVANAPKGQPPDRGGALWRCAPATADAPELVAEFPGLRPEGLAPTPDGRALAVLFDRGGATPEWTLLPLPRAPE